MGSGDWGGGRHQRAGGAKMLNRLHEEPAVQSLNKTEFLSLHLLCHRLHAQQLSKLYVDCSDFLQFSTCPCVPVGLESLW